MAIVKRAVAPAAVKGCKNRSTVSAQIRQADEKTARLIRRFLPEKRKILSNN